MSLFTERMRDVVEPQQYMLLPVKCNLFEQSTVTKTLLSKAVARHTSVPSTAIVYTISYVEDILWQHDLYCSCLLETDDHEEQVAD